MPTRSRIAAWYSGRLSRWNGREPGLIGLFSSMTVSIVVSGGGPQGWSLGSLNPLNAFSGLDGSVLHPDTGATLAVAGTAGIGLFFAFWSWVGFESTAMYGEESRNPKKIIPLATMLSVLGIGIFYVIVSWSAIVGTGPDNAVALAQDSATAGQIFFWTGMVTAFSYLIAVRIAARVGLINTMVFTHLPANLCLVAIPFIPDLAAAIALLLVRGLLSQMDVPTRTSYVMAVVTPEERAAAASITAVPRSLASAASPMLAGYLLGLSSFGWPLLIGGLPWKRCSPR